MATVYYKIVDLQQYLADVETQLNTLGNDGWELSTIFNEQAILISGSSGITVSGSVVLPAGVVSSSAQVKTYLPSGTVSSSTQATNWTVLSSSYAVTASHVPTAYGQWYSAQIQTTTANTASFMYYDSQSFARGFTYSGSRIYALQDGIYNLQFSAQFHNTANTNINIDVWLKQDGNDVDDSNTLYEIDKQPSARGTTVAALNYMLQMNSGSYAELAWNSNASTAQLYYTGSGVNPTRPAVPSVITTITQVG